LQDAIRIATKFIKVERDCITGEGWYILADSVDGAMDALREMWTLYVPSTEPLPPGNGGAVVPSLPGRETEMFFRNLANEFEQMYVVVQEGIAREYGLGVVVPGGNAVLGSTKSTGDGDGLSQAEVRFRLPQLCFLVTPPSSFRYLSSGSGCLGHSRTGVSHGD
jgi:hypothetical protein